MGRSGAGVVEATTTEVIQDFGLFMRASGIRETDLTRVLTREVDPDGLNRPLNFTAISTPPQEGKTTWIVHYLAWQLIRNPWLNVVYASYSQTRANAVSRQVRAVVSQWTRLKRGSSNVGYWETAMGGGLLSAGRGSAMTGFSSDLTVIDDPVKDMQEAHSNQIRETTLEWLQSVVLTRMASRSQVVIVATRWHKDDLIAHAVKHLDAKYVNVPAQAVDDETDPLGRKPGEWLRSVQNRTNAMWERIKQTVGTYVWQALYQGDPKVTGGAYIDTSKIDLIPWEQVVYRDPRGFSATLVNAYVVQSWDLAFTGKGDYVAGQTWANISGTWVMVDRVHGRYTFTETVSEVQKMAARWPQTAKVYVENAANGAALIDTLKTRAALITPVTPRGSKEVRALAVQPMIEQGQVKVVDAIWDDNLRDELQEFPFAAHDDQVDALTQALLSGKANYFKMGD